MLRGVIKAGLFFRDPANRAKVTADYAVQTGVTTDIATAVVKESFDRLTGESPIALLNRQGLINTIQLRGEFGGFTNPNINPIYMALPGNGYYDDRFWLAAMQSVFSPL